MPVHEIDPLRDAAWNAFAWRHPCGGVFHTQGWLQALSRTYGYKPVVFTASAPGEALQDGVVFCEIRSWVTGRRLVSLPFSDHCDPLVDSAAETEILGEVRRRTLAGEYKYAEIRPMATAEAAWSEALNLLATDRFCMHTLALDAPLETLFHGLHKDCFQRKIRRAEREHLAYEKGQSEPLLRQFYQLLLRTRRRHCLPPQPMQWFRNLLTSMGEHLTIRVASKDGRPVAAILTLSFKDTVTYKYGCSDERFHHFGGTPFLFWMTIQEAKAEGMRRLDLGRSEMNNPGLIGFKDRLGAHREQLTYWRYSGRERAQAPRPPWLEKVAKQLFPRLPDAALAASGRLLYRHLG